MESVKKRSRWVLVAALATLTGVVLLASPWSASATSGNPQLTLTLTATSTQITGSGTYSDDQGVCVTSGKTVTWTIRTGNQNGPIVESGTTTTDGSGNYSFTSSVTLSTDTKYFVSVSVAGSLSGGYGAGDSCMNVTTKGSITTQP
jgi:hypothetical protein